ncbi:unnamed protein product [Pylaiella littoralis]
MKVTLARLVLGLRLLALSPQLTAGQERPSPAPAPGSARSSGAPVADLIRNSAPASIRAPSLTPAPASASLPEASPTAPMDYPNCQGNLFWIGDGYCDTDKNNAECGYDGGDCCECECEDSEASDGFLCSTNGYDCTDPNADRSCEKQYPLCQGNTNFIGDGICDSDVNNVECDYDGGDCCECECANPGSSSSCFSGIYDCLNPDADRSCEEHPLCQGNRRLIGDGFCNVELNIADCGYDEGDCCECECGEFIGNSFSCGFAGYNCVDPDADTSCEGTEICSDGTEGVDGNGVVCCAIGCATCGGGYDCALAGYSVGLDASDCCGGPIKASGVYCDGTNNAPCIIGPPPSTPEPGMCTDGTEGIDGNGVVCCPLGCGQCGGSNCDVAGNAAGLGAGACCGGAIKASGVYCAETNQAPCIIGTPPSTSTSTSEPGMCTDAPCIIGTPPSTSTSTSETNTCIGGTEGIDGNGVVCCPLGCGECGGSKCGKAGTAAGLGADACCGGAIKDSGVYCDDTYQAPCIIGSAP